MNRGHVKVNNIAHTRGEFTIIIMICFGCGDDISSRSSDRRLLDSPSSIDVLNIWKELFKERCEFPRWGCLSMLLNSGNLQLVQVRHVLVPRPFFLQAKGR